MRCMRFLRRMTKRVVKVLFGEWFWIEISSDMAFFSCTHHIFFATPPPRPPILFSYQRSTHSIGLLFDVYHLFHFAHGQNHVDLHIYYLIAFTALFSFSGLLGT